ncbi:(13S,14R)-1,13-dihydroxy-N-methylcanadine 13-O-acetyltransferase AT1-like [Impatiens glandulifera]|uniref:(13S,14R)-1,13-dihydroxy-N-methylcanadine 13-O-acetyltransferase AT1-like n=1 Tax=Impatiens glandulifera TaxID=253017 RepID=UPI001FB14A84|nr:(13S,14R)-1,13-dihydroxy-N-methylcanadine 13-O-acetyltransferase AT1-like [Impatiens glandulifera]
MSKLHVNIISKERILKSSPTPLHSQRYNLSFLDQSAIQTYMRFILFYPNVDDFSTKIDLLKRSLSHTLNVFYPFAGYFAGEESAVVGGDEFGAEFVEAEVGEGITLNDVVKDPDFVGLEKLFLPRKEIQRGEDGEVQLSVQATGFCCGGVAVGVCVSHKIADGVSATTFMKYWATVASNEQKLGMDNLNIDLPPTYDGPRIWPKQAISASRPLPDLDMGTGTVTKRFVFDATSIANLRAKATKIDEPNVTRVEAITALMWSCLISLSPEREKVLMFAINLRQRLSPPLSNQSFGNITKSVLMPIGKPSFLGSRPELCHLVELFRESVTKVDDGYSRKTHICPIINMILHEPFLKVVERMQENLYDLYFVTSWCRLPFYEIDFGWGRPIWFTNPFRSNFPIILLTDEADGIGVEVLVCLSKEDMAKFENDPILLAFSNAR